MKKLLVCLCLLSFQASANDVLFSCQQAASRLSTKLQVVDISSVQATSLVMVVKNNDLGTTYLFGEKKKVPSPIYSLNKLKEYTLVDLTGNKFDLEVSTMFFPSRACSPRAGQCGSKHTTASLTGEYLDETYSCL